MYTTRLIAKLPVGREELIYISNEELNALSDQAFARLIQMLDTALFDRGIFHKHVVEKIVDQRISHDAQKGALTYIVEFRVTHDDTEFDFKENTDG